MKKNIYVQTDSKYSRCRKFNWHLGVWKWKKYIYIFINTQLFGFTSNIFLSHAVTEFPWARLSQQIFYLLDWSNKCPRCICRTTRHVCEDRVAPISSLENRKMQRSATAVTCWSENSNETYSHCYIESLEWFQCHQEHNKSHYFMSIIHRTNPPKIFPYLR